MNLAEAIRKVSAGGSLAQEEANAVANAIMAGEATPAQIAGLLVALRMKGETVVEATAFAQTMRSHVVPVHAKRTPLLDTCGTGGGTFRVFNVSTASAFVAAAAGIAVAKHGNRAMSGVCGSADVLEALGVRLDLTPEQCADCIDTVGICFLFAQKHHPAMRHVAAPRREIGVRTLFNLLGPITNPAGATRQVLGVYDRALCRLVAETLQQLGTERALVLHAEVGAVEIMTLGKTYACELRNSVISEMVLTPTDFGLEGTEPKPEDLAPAATPSENATLLREVLGGNTSSPQALARRNLVALNAAAALCIGGAAEDWKAGLERAFALLDSGDALETLERYISFTQRQGASNA